MIERSQHMTWYGYDAEGKPLYRPKKSFDTENEALLACFRINLNPRTIYKAVAYKCPKCGKWHIGHHKGIGLNAHERMKIQSQFEKYKVLNGIK